MLPPSQPEFCAASCVVVLSIAQVLPFRMFFHLRPPDFSSPGNWFRNRSLRAPCHRRSIPDALASRPVPGNPVACLHPRISGHIVRPSPRPLESRLRSPSSGLRDFGPYPNGNGHSASPRPWHSLVGTPEGCGTPSDRKNPSRDKKPP